MMGSAPKPLVWKYQQFLYAVCYLLAGRPRRVPNLRGYRPHRDSNLKRHTRRKLAILERDDYICRYCGLDMLGSMDAFMATSLDHVVPLSAGGEDHPDNIVSCCQTCNFLKGALPTVNVEEGLQAIEARRQERAVWMAERLAKRRAERLADEEAAAVEAIGLVAQPGLVEKGGVS